MNAKRLVLGLIPARSGSKGLPGKNTRILAGKPLLAHAVDCARASAVVDRIVLSTDSEEIAQVGVAWGAEAPFLRPAELATDEASMLSVVEHAVRTLSEGGWIPDVVVLLQPTSPLRRAEHVRSALSLLLATGADSVVSVIEVPRHLSPDYVMRIEQGNLLPFLPSGAVVTRRQDARPAFARDGTVYAFWRRTVIEQRSLYGATCRAMVVPPTESLSIDSSEDWAEGERRLTLGPTLS